MYNLIDIFRYYYIETILYQYSDFNGRSTRGEFWYFTLFHVIIIYLLTLLDNLLGLLGYLYFFYLLMTFPASLSILVRRLHDTNNSGWWYALIIFPVMILDLNQNGIIEIQYFFVLLLLSLHYVLLIVLVVFLILNGDEGKNRYGKNPNELWVKEDIEEVSTDVEE